MTLPPSSLTPLSIASCAFSVSLARDDARRSRAPSRSTPRDPHAGLLAQPRRDVVLVVDFGSSDSCERLVDQLVGSSPRGSSVRSTLPAASSDVVALVALGAHGALEVDRGVRPGRRSAGSASAAPPPPPQPASSEATGAGGEGEESGREASTKRTDGAQRTAIRRANARRCTPSCASERAGRPPLVPPHEHRLFAGKTCPQNDTDSSNVGRMTTIVLQSGTKWGTFPLAKPVRGGGAPPTPPPRIDSTPSARPDMSLGLPRQLRTHARREAPAHGAVEVPRRSWRARCSSSRARTAASACIPNTTYSALTTQPSPG